MYKYLSILALTVITMVASTCLAAPLTEVSVVGFSTRLGTTWEGSMTLDADLSTFWMTSKTDGAPYIIYQISPQATALGTLTITNVPASSYRAIDSARISYCADDSGTYTELGVYSMDNSVAGETEIDLAGTMAKFVKIEPLTNYYYGTVNTIADHTQDGSATWIVGFAEAVFTEAGGYANAGTDIEVYDADDNAEEPVTLDGSASDFPDGSITAYSWKEDGTEIATGVSPTVTLAVGNHEIVLTCTLSDSTTDSDTVIVTVVGTPQSFASAGDDIVVTDTDDNGSETVTLDGTNSAWSTATWNWYEGATHLGSGSTLSVSLTVGIHNITVQCTDMSGHNDSDDVIVTILDGSPKPPVANAGLDRSVENKAGGAGEPVALDGSASQDYDGTIVSYVWSEGGTQIATGVNPTVTLPIGVHTITLTVTDDDSTSDTDEVVITVLEYTSQGDAPRVGAWEADNLFDDITADDMAIISSKKILLASRSFGYNLHDGLNNLKNQNAMYALNYSGGYNVLAGGYDALPVDVFDNYNFVQYLATYWPHTVRITEQDWFIRNRYHDDLDAAIIFFHTAVSGLFPTYQSIMDSLRLDYPNIKFIYVTSGCSPIADDANNATSHAFSQAVIAEYDGLQPIYDMNSILSTHPDGTACVNTAGVPYMCPEFNINGDNTHPNSDFSETRMGKGMLVLLKEMFCQGEPEPKPGDANGDDAVNLDDFIILKQNYGSSNAEWSQGDFNGDGSVNLDDFIILKQNYGS